MRRNAGVGVEYARGSVTIKMNEGHLKLRRDFEPSYPGSLRRHEVVFTGNGEVTFVLDQLEIGR